MGFIDKPLTPAIVLNSADEPIPEYKLAEGGAWDEYNDNKEYIVSFEIPIDWDDFRSGAEPVMCHLYKYEDSDDDDIDMNKPIICITPELYDRIDEFEQTGTIKTAFMCEAVSIGKMFMRAKIKRLDSIVYFYAFHELNQNYSQAISLWYKEDILDTPLEKKLIEILDHAAETYTETPKED